MLLPDIGGIESHLGRGHRNRRALHDHFTPRSRFDRPLFINRVSVAPDHEGIGTSREGRAQDLQEIPLGSG